MRGYLEVWFERGPELRPLEGTHTTIGRDPSNTIAVTSDPAVSRHHAVVEQFPTGWTIRDLSSSNGTMLNGERLVSEHHLRPGDEIRVGETRIVFRGDVEEVSTPTARTEPAPQVTPRERDVLVALCRPLLGGATFPEPASIHQLAAELVVSEAAVKFHLANLYDKFGIYETTTSRRVRLANEAIRRRAVTLTDLRDS